MDWQEKNILSKRPPVLHDQCLEKHAAMTDVSNITAISYIGMQVFPQMQHHIFCPVTSATISFCTRHYHLSPSTSLLCRLAVSPQVKNGNIKVHADDLRIFDVLDKGIQKVEAAIKSFLKKGKGKVAQEILDDDE